MIGARDISSSLSSLVVLLGEMPGLISIARMTGGTTYPIKELQRGPTIAEGIERGQEWQRG